MLPDFGFANNSTDDDVDILAVPPRQAPFLIPQAGSCERTANPDERVVQSSNGKSSFLIVVLVIVFHSRCAFSHPV